MRIAPSAMRAGLPYLEEALAELDPRTQTNALALAMALMGRYYHYRTEHNKAIEFLERARQLAEPLDDPATLSNIYTFLAGAHQHLLHYDESDRWARVSIAMGERKKFPVGDRVGLRVPGGECRGPRAWDDALAFAAQDRDEGQQDPARWRASRGAEFCTRAGAARQGRARRRANATALSALELCDQIGEVRLGDLDRSAGGANCGGPGRR